jgi:hypothetical protein
MNKYKYYSYNKNNSIQNVYNKNNSIQDGGCFCDWFGIGCETTDNPSLISPTPRQQGMIPQVIVSQNRSILPPSYTSSTRQSGMIPQVIVGQNRFPPPYTPYTSYTPSTISFTGWKITKDNTLQYFKKNVLVSGSDITIGDCIEFNGNMKINERDIYKKSIAKVVNFKYIDQIKNNHIELTYHRFRNFIEEKDNLNIYETYHTDPTKPKKNMDTLVLNIKDYFRIYENNPDILPNIWAYLDKNVNSIAIPYIRKITCPVETKTIDNAVEIDITKKLLKIRKNSGISFDIKKDMCIRFTDNLATIGQTTNIKELDRIGLVDDVGTLPDKGFIRLYKFNEDKKLFDSDKNYTTILAENVKKDQMLNKVDCPEQKILASFKINKDKKTLTITKSNQEKIILEENDCIKFSIDKQAMSNNLNRDNFDDHNKDDIYKIIKFSANFLNTLFQSTYKNEFENIKVIFIKVSDPYKREYKLEINNANKDIINSIKKETKCTTLPIEPEKITYSVADKTFTIIKNDKSSITLKQDDCINFNTIDLTINTHPHTKSNIYKIEPIKVTYPSRKILFYTNIDDDKKIYQLDLTDTTLIELLQKLSKCNKPPVRPSPPPPKK